MTMPHLPRWAVEAGDLFFDQPEETSAMTQPDVDSDTAHPDPLDEDQGAGTSGATVSSLLVGTDAEILARAYSYPELRELYASLPEDNPNLDLLWQAIELQTTREDLYPTGRQAVAIADRMTAGDITGDRALTPPGPLAEAMTHAMTHARSPAEDRGEDSIHHAQHTLTQITQQRAADQHRTATQARAEQLARWHSHDQETHAGAAHPAEPDRMEPRP